ncbi:hypothetical protein [Micromonospora sp. NPDC049645]|uniref:hypothetical protein n=1 Tax=Micromonospora sp. NPDC049645 TaxID=3155508 RepID=UPI00343113AB
MEEDEDGVGDPYWTALLAQDAPGDGQATLDEALARLPRNRRPGPSSMEKCDRLLTAVQQS